MANTQWLTGSQVAGAGNLNQTGGTIASLGSGSGSLQGGTVSQGGTSPQVGASVQSPYNPNNLTDPVVADPTVDTTYDPNVAAARAAARAAAAQAAAEAARLGTLRGDITRLVNGVKDIFNARYGLVDTAAGDQASTLNSRYATESGNLANDITDQNNEAAASFAGRGTFDSSDRGNTQDKITREGQNQIASLGDELAQNLSKVGQWASSQKSGFDAEKGGLDSILTGIAQSTDANELAGIKSQIESKMIELQNGASEYNTNAQNKQALESITPSSQRAVKLKTTLSQIVGGNSDANTKLAIGSKIIDNAQLTPSEKEQLLMAFQSDISTTDKTQQ